MYLIRQKLFVLANELCEILVAWFRNLVVQILEMILSMQYQQS